MQRLRAALAAVLSFTALNTLARLGHPGFYFGAKPPRADDDDGQGDSDNEAGTLDECAALPETREAMQLMCHLLAHAWTTMEAAGLLEVAF